MGLNTFFNKRRAERRSGDFNLMLKTQRETDMSATKTTKGPIKTHSDGSIRLKIWRNEVSSGTPYFNVTIEKSYFEPESGKWRDTKLFSRDDMLKLQPLLNEAYQTIRQEQALDREYARTQTQETEPGLSAQRNAAMANASEPQHSGRQETDRESRPRRPRQPEQ